MISHIAPLLLHLEKQVEDYPTKECIENHFNQWEAIIDDSRKLYHFYVRCNECDKKFYNLHIWKESW